eukprot:m.208286 g.208286  ORF g.208286 m.208286 type:complete len:156 (+) comp39702_c0_seq45:557-1024(+)
MSVVIQGGFPFLDDGNATKFRGLFVPALKKVQRQVHSTLGHEDSALEFVETLLYQILASVCFVQPRSSSEVEDRVQKTFPHPIEGWAVKEAQRALENHTSKKKQELVFPADKLHSLLQKVSPYVLPFRSPTVSLFFCRERAFYVGLSLGGVRLQV